MVATKSPFVSRWLKFNVIGAVGFLLQTAVLAAVNNNVPIAIATAIATEAALLHNFFWHLRITWPESRGTEVARRLLLFHAGNGMVSLIGNSAIAWLLVDMAHVHYLFANSAAVLLCSLLNFAISDRIVFRPRQPLRAP